MKKTIFAFFLLMAAGSAPAQLHFDIRAGVSASGFGEQHLKMGFRGGVNAEYLFNDHFGLRTGLFYTMKGATASNNVFNYDADKATRLSYIDLPVEAVAAFGLSRRLRLEIHAGPYIACLIRSRAPSTADFNAKRWDAGVGVGFDFVAGHFIIGPEVQYGLTRLTSSDSGHNTTYALTLGYRF